LIVQSYVIRNYTLLVFLLSLAFYYYLKWQENPDNKKIFLYFLFAILSVATHFCAIFAIFCIAAFETIKIFRGSDKKDLAKWVICNIAIALFYFVLCYIWRETTAPFAFAAFREAYIIKEKITPFDLLVSGAFYPLLISYYVLPSHNFVYLIVPAIIFSWNIKKEHRYIILLTFTAFLLGMILVATGTYQYLSSRRSLWIAPFLIIGTGVAISDLFEILNEHIKQKKYFNYFAIFAIFIFGLLSYDKNQRFSETQLIGDLPEYNKIKKSELDSIYRQLSIYDKNSIIMLDRGKIFTFSKINPYSYLDNNSFGKGEFKIIPYQNTEIIFPSNYYGYEEIFKDNLESKFLGKKNIIIIKTMFFNDIIDKIAKNCQVYAKQIIKFKTSELVIFSKEDFFGKIILPDGISNSCIKQN
ncbi:MAG: hypothetical protein WCJ33_00115, partial [Pseudomonadota bacterium]